MTTQNDFLYSLYVTFLCAPDIFKKLFGTLVMLIYKTVSLRRMSSRGFFCTLHIIITVRWTFVWALFSSLHLGMVPGLVVVDLVNLESVNVSF